MKGFSSNLDKDILCKCGHNHISYTGDQDKEEAGDERIIPCEKCDCENFVEQKKRRIQ